MKICEKQLKHEYQQTLSHRNYSYNDENPILKKCKIEINCYISQIFILGFGSFTLLWLSYLHPCTHVRYVAFNINSPAMYLNVFITHYLLFIIRTLPNFGCVFELALKFSKIITWTIFGLVVFQIWCYSYNKK